MSICPHCGASVDDGDAACGSCGTSLRQGRYQPPGDAETSPESRPDGSEKERSGRQGERPESRGGEDRTESPRERGDEDGSYLVIELGRREALAAGGVALAALGGGAFALLDGRGPKETVRQYLAALNDRDFDAALSLAHPKTTVQDGYPTTRWLNREDDWTVADLSVAERSGGEVRIEVSFRHYPTHVVTLCKYEGEWRIHESETVGPFEGG